MFIIYGSRYIGWGNRRKYWDVCEQCGQQGQLVDSDAKNWATLYGIPVFPMTGRLRLQGRCKSCDQMRYMAWNEWRQVGEAALGDVYRRLAEVPADAETGEELLGAIAAFATNDEGHRAVEELVRQFPDSVGVQMAARAWYDSTGNRAAALACCRRALVLEPGNEAAAAIVREADAGLLAKAEALEAQAPPLTGAAHKTADALVYRARAHLSDGQEDRAGELAADALAANPALGHDKSFRRLVRQCDTAAPLAAKIALPAWNPLRSKVFRKWACRLVFVAALVAGGRYYGARQRVHVVNGLGEPVRVAIDGGSETTIGAGERRTIGVWGGQHRATFTGPGGMTSSVEFRASSPFDEWGGRSRVYVLNPFGAAVVARETIHYSTTKSNLAGPTQKLFIGAQLITPRSLDYVFDEFPESVEAQSGVDIVSRDRLTVIEAEPWQVLNGLREDETVQTGRLLAFGEAHVNARPNDITLLTLYSTAATHRKELPRAAAFLKKRLGERPALMDWHRAYQSVAEMADGAVDLAAEYDVMLEAEPGNSRLLYLRGRIEVLAGKTLPFMAKAIAADNANAYAHMAKAYSLVSTGRFEEALASAKEAAGLMPEHSSMAATYDRALLATGGHDDLLARCRAEIEKAPPGTDLTGGLVMPLLAAGRRSEAQRLHDQRIGEMRSERGGKDDGAIRYVRVTYLLSVGRYAEARSVAGQFKPDEGRAWWAFCAAAGLGDATDAAKWVGQMPEPSGDVRLYLSVVQHSAGRTAEAARNRRAAAEEMAKGDRQDRLWARLLAAGSSADAALAADVTGEPHTKAMRLVAVVQAGADGKLLTLAEKLNFEHGWQRGVIASAIRKLRDQAP